MDAIPIVSSRCHMAAKKVAKKSAKKVVKKTMNGTPKKGGCCGCC